MISRRALLATSACSLLPVRGDELFGDAEAYEKFMGRWSRQMAAQLVDFASIGQSGRILDVGSGTGALAFAIAARNPACELVGIDPSKEYVAYASSRNKFGKRVRFEVGDAQQLPFPAASFDHSASLLVWNFIPDPMKALREVARVTKPGGRIAAAVWDYGAGMRMLRVFWDAVVATDPAADSRDEKHMALCRAGELAELWKKAGLAQVEEHPLQVTLRFQSFADYWDPFLLGQGPAGAYVRQLDRPRAEKLRTEVKRRLGVRDESSGIDLEARVWAVRGTRQK